MKDMNIEEMQFFTVIILTAFIHMMLSIIFNNSQSAVFSLVIIFGGFLFHKTYSDFKRKSIF